MLSPLASPSTVLPFAVNVVNVPAAGVVPPTVPSNVPELISALDITTEPVPFGVMLMFSFDLADTISKPTTSKFPPNCGEVSSDMFPKPDPTIDAQPEFEYPSIFEVVLLYLISPFAGEPGL